MEIISNSPVAHIEICKAVELFLNPNDVSLSLWKDEKLRGGVIYSRYTDVSIFMHVAGFMPNWFNREFLWMCFDYPFNQLHVRQVVGLVNSQNTHTLRFASKLGFAVAAIIKDVYANGHEVVLVMHRGQCRWLDKEITHNGAILKI